MNPRLNKILIIDGSYMISRSLHVQELWDLKTKDGRRTGGLFGFLRSLNHEFKKYDYYPVVTWDSGLAERRVKAYEKYKNAHLRTAEKMMRNCSDETELSIKLEEKFLNESTLNEVIRSVRETLAGSRLQDAQKFDEDDYRAQYARQRDILITILHSIGVPSIKISGWEGDDLMVLLTRLSKESVVMTDDKDLIQLIAPNVQIARPMKGERLIYEDYLPEQGLLSSRQIAMIKAIEGDGSDNIPGVTDGLERKYCLGHVRAKAVAEIILKNNEIPEAYLAELRDSGKNPYLGFVQRYEDYKRNMELVDLSLVPDDEAVMDTIVTEVLAHAGKCNFLEATQLLAEQEVSNFDLNAFIAKMSVLSCGLKIGAGGN